MHDVGGIILPRIDSCHCRRSHTPQSPQRRHLSFLLHDLGGKGDSHPCPGHRLGDPRGHHPPPSPRGESVKESPSPGSHSFCSRLIRPSGVAFIYEILYGTTFICPCFWGGVEDQMFLTTNFFCFLFLKILQEVWSSITPLVKLTVTEIFIGINMDGLLSRHSIHRRQHRRLI